MSLADPRLRRRHEYIVNKVVPAPDLSFPQAFQNDSDLEATYRFLNNERVTYDQLLAPHYEQTVARLADAKTALAVHDTTAMVFGGECDRAEVGTLDGKRAGYLAHFSLAVLPGEDRRTLGVLGFEPTFRLDGPRSADEREHWRKRQNSPDRESLRWLRMVDEVCRRVGGRAELIHVMDAEGDSYELLSHLITNQHRFVIRVAQERRLEGSGSLSDALAGSQAVVCRQVRLGARSRLASRGHKSQRQAREARSANLHVSATQLTLRRPNGRNSLPATLTLNVVQVRELEPPEGEQAVEWKLYTSEPIDAPESILAIVDNYRSRWTIEEFFKALKTGCSYEKRQLESRHALLNALGILAPIAWRLLVLRQDSRSEATTTTALTEQQVQVLRAVTRRPLPERPTASDVMLAVAALGGHIKNNGDPGWLVLGRGLCRLLDYEVGWAAARQNL